MKSLIILLLIASWSFASEYVSIQPNNLVQDMVTKVNGKVGARLSYSRLSIKLLKDAANSKSYESNPNTFNPQTWYTPNGWRQFKVYIPAGVKTAQVSFSVKPNASLRIHLTYRADSAVVDHTSSIIDENEFNKINDTRTHAYQADSLLNIDIDPAIVNSTNGGYVYIDIVEDSMNQPSYYGDVNPKVSMSLLAIIGDINAFNAWKDSVAVDALGNPGDAIARLSIIDKTGPSTTATRTIPMDPAVDLSLIDADNDGEMANVDCNDNDRLINSSATEIPNNGIDEDCSGEDLVDPNADYDQDGEKAAVDCNDYDANINTSATDIANNGIDEDCSGEDLIDLTILDADNDGHMADVDCNDNNRFVNPSAVEIPGNGIDDDCKDGDAVKAVCNFWEPCYVDPNPNPNPTPVVRDNDKDGYNADVDCNDYNPLVHPDATEIAGNGIDDDCKGGDAKPEPVVETIDLEKEARDASSAVAAKVFTFQGVFSQYEFSKDRSKEAFNWVFIDPAGNTSQLLGIEPTSNNVFGWKSIAPLAQTPERNWYMFAADIDGDGKLEKFEWLIVSANPDDSRVYKLAGAKDDNTFLYSDEMDVKYKLVNNQVIEFE